MQVDDIASTKWLSAPAPPQGFYWHLLRTVGVRFVCKMVGVDTILTLLERTASTVPSQAPKLHCPNILALQAAFGVLRPALSKRSAA